MSNLNVLVQSDYFIQLVALGSVILMGLLTYVFGFKGAKSSDDEILHVETRETKKQKAEKAKKAEQKDKKKPKAVAVVAPTPVINEAPVETEQPSLKKVTMPLF